MILDTLMFDFSSFCLIMFFGLFYIRIYIPTGFYTA